MKSAPPRRRGEKSRIISPTYPKIVGSGECFKFFYHLMGTGIDSLNVWLRQSGQTTKKLLEYKSSYLDNRWRLGQVTVKSDVEFEIVLEGESSRVY